MLNEGYNLYKFTLLQNYVEGKQTDERVLEPYKFALLQNLTALTILHCKVLDLYDFTLLQNLKFRVAY